MIYWIVISEFSIDVFNLFTGSFITKQFKFVIASQI